MSLSDDNWLWPSFQFDTSSAVSKVEVPESGGWILKFRGGDGSYSHVFAPNLATWTAAIAQAIATAKNAPIEVASDFDVATHDKQTPPS